MVGIIFSSPLIFSHLFSLSLALALSLSLSLSHSHNLSLYEAFICLLSFTQTIFSSFSSSLADWDCLSLSLALSLSVCLTHSLSLTHALSLSLSLFLSLTDSSFPCCSTSLSNVGIFRKKTPPPIHKSSRSSWFRFRWQQTSVKCLAGWTGEVESSHKT